MNRFHSIAFVAGQPPEACDAYDRLSALYGNAEPAQADVIVALGGDGLMLQTLHNFMRSGKPIYGMHRGTVGFLMNDYAVEHLRERLTAAKQTVIHPLLMSARDAMYYTLTGETFDGKKAAELKVVNEAAPLDQLRARVRQIADSMLEKNPHTLKAAKDAIKRVAEMTVDASEDYLVVRQEALNYLDKSEGRKQGLKQFIDDKTYRPGLGAYRR